mmetsp:Transcript_29701/g.95066  ORF Transcript_29701/g.95066 Transcript_29701/m.95066 type:complete len:410 (+) Transcript_29701:1117-2346(+)
MPGIPLREMSHGRSPGACARCARQDAWHMSSACKGRTSRSGKRRPNPWQRACSSSIAYSLLSFQVPTMPRRSSATATRSCHHAAAAGFVKSRCEPSASQNMDRSGEYAAADGVEGQNTAPEEGGAPAAAAEAAPEAPTKRAAAAQAAYSGWSTKRQGLRGGASSVAAGPPLAGRGAGAWDHRRRILDVGGEVHASGGISGGEPVRVGHFAAVPREDVPAAGGGGGVAAGELEGGERHLPRRALGEKGLELPLGVGRIGEGHRRARVAERPARRQQRLAGQPREAGRHAAYPRPEQHVVVEVATLGLVAREEAVVVVELAPKVERRPRHRVIKDTVRAPPPARDRAQRRRLAVHVRTERLRGLPRPGRVGGARARLADVKGVKLVERIAPLGVVPHGVDAAQVESPTRAV